MSDHNTIPSQNISGADLPVTGLPAQDFQVQGFPAQGFPGQDLPPQESYVQDLLTQGFPAQNFPTQGAEQQLPMPDFTEDFLSPEYEVPPHSFPTVSFPSQTIGLGDSDHLAVFPSSATNRSLENILLEGAGMDESIDLGVSSYLDATDEVASDIEVQEEAGLDSTLVEDSNGRTNSTEHYSNSVAAVGGINILEAGANAITSEDCNEPVATSTIEIHSSSIASFQVASENSIQLFDTASNNIIDADISGTSHIFYSDTVEDDLSSGIITNDPSPEVKFEIADISEDTSKVSESVHSMKIVTEEAVDVGFVVEEEKKDKSLDESASTTLPNSRSLMTLFAAADSAGGTDIEGKNFFDSFSTGIEESAEVPPTSPRSLGPTAGSDPPFASTVAGLQAIGVPEAGSFYSIENTEKYNTVGQISSFDGANQMDAYGIGHIGQPQASDAFGNIGQVAVGGFSEGFEVAPQPFGNQTALDIGATQSFGTHVVDSFDPMTQTQISLPIDSVDGVHPAFSTQIHSASISQISVPYQGTSPQSIISGVPAPLTSPSVLFHEPKLDFGWQTPSPAVTAASLDGLGNLAATREDENRRYDAWIPSEGTARVIAQAVGQEPGGTGIPVAPSPAQLCRPGVVSADLLGDPIYDLVVRTMGEQEANKRLVLNADSVPQDDVGLRQLIKSDCLRSAVDLTGRLLAAHCGQGPGRMGQVSQHTPYSLQLWFTRLALMVKLRLFSQAEVELEAFGSLDSPDLYYEYQQEHFPLRRGSMVPFGLRLLHGEMPHICGRAQESFDRLYHMLAVIDKMLSNLSQKLTEDGSGQLNETSAKVSVDLWKSRRTRVLYSVGSCLLGIKDYTAAIEVYERLVKEDEKNKGHLYSGLGRIHLQMGDIATATWYFEASEALMDMNVASSKCQRAVNKGLTALCGNQYPEAYQHFKEAVDIEPSNITAVNNMAVCQLYLGRLSLALQALEALIFSDPLTHLQESTVLNLCTLYELESSKALVKKQRLLSLISQHKGNGFNVACLKMS